MRTPGELIQLLDLKHKTRNNSPVRAWLKENRAKKPRILQRARQGLWRAVGVVHGCWPAGAAAWGTLAPEDGRQQKEGANRYLGKER